jgi:hypothetical protein
MIATDTKTPPSRRLALLIALAMGVIALVLRWYYVTHAQVLQPVDEPNVTGDAVDYYRYAWNLVHHATFSSTLPGSSNVVPNSFRDPGYPTLMAAWMLAFPRFEAWYAAMLLTQAALGAATVSILVIAARRWLSATGLAGAGLLMAIWPHSVTLPSFLLSENLFAFLCAAALLLSVEAFARDRRWMVAVAGMAWSLAALTNAVMLPFGVVLGVALWLLKLIPPRMALIFILTTVAFPLAWGARSLLIPPSATSTGRAIMNLVQGSWPNYHADYQSAAKGDPRASAELHAMDDEMLAMHDDKSEGLGRVVGRISAEPLRYLGWYISKPALLWSWDIRIGQGDVYVYPTRNSPLKPGGALVALEVICFILNPLVAALALLGSLLALFRRPQRSDLLATALAPLFATAVYAVLQSEPRYSIPFRGFELLLAAYAVAWLSRWRPRKLQISATRVTLPER